MSSKVPSLTLNNGLKIPMLGLGTWGSPQGEVARAVKEALDLGYRHIDCAFVYGNEQEVGDGLAAKIADGTVKREDVWVTSKLWNTFHSAHLVRPALEKTLQNLQLKQLDLYLIHWPMGYKEGGEIFPADTDGKTLFSDVDYLETWKGMEECLKAGLTRSIGLSNFNIRQVERVLAAGSVKPAMNQVEYHPYLHQTELSQWCRAKGIEITGYSPLGSPARPWVKSGDPVLLEEPKVLEVAQRCNKSVAQVLIRWQLQLGHITIPKSTNSKRIQENFDVFDFELSKQDMEDLSSLNRNERFVPMSMCAGHKYHSFENNEFAD
ncbi:aldo-keto reductase family 1 member B1-like [Phlebotomus argentipes]|uniref:aldo-keto reductase family 1 member B1-like n=1 Tax=Phlebotomus argentipes TaxID=94469 RepID=UPI002892C2BF|nr:aldo-keto reductase family 1 member B1-like [Phlebotomus argentipes]